MIRKALLLRIFDAAYMKRWNDKICPVDFFELDKQAHKMIIAYFLGKFEEKKKGFDWIEIIEGGLFELMQRLVITDLKPPIFYKIKEDKEKYKKLNEWVYSELAPLISPLGEAFCQRFKNYFTDGPPNINRNILNAAHFYASRWEFNIIERANPEGYEISTIDKSLKKNLEKYNNLIGIHQLLKYTEYKNFIDLAGSLRFQQRWAHLHRFPKTSVLGHSLFVAILSYLFSYDIEACKKRSINNYLTGLFHDLPEILTRDIISPVKRSVEGLADLIKEYEREQMKKEVYGFIPKSWHSEIKMYSENEFESIIIYRGLRKTVKSNQISKMYNEDKFNPRDGELVKAADELAAFIEASEAIINGSQAQEIQKAKLLIKDKYERSNIAGINFGEIYADFD